MNITMHISAIIILGSMILPVKASKVGNILVYSSEQSNGSVSIGKRWAYTKNVEVNVINMSNSELDLSTVCFRSFSPEQKEFKLDTIDEKLTKGILKPKQIIRGSLMFASDKTSIHQSVLIKLSDECR